jgi:hypothetical protein
MNGTANNESAGSKKKSYAGTFFYLLVTVCASLAFSPLKAQQKDFGVWASVSARHKITQKLSVTVEEQFRFNQNATAIGQYFTDAGLEYALSKKFKLGISYRFINSFQNTYYSKRHRVYVDLSFKTKYSSLQIILRTRLQEQQKDLYSSETGYLPEWYSRNKVTLKLNNGRKFLPYVSTELFYMIAAPNTVKSIVDKMRYTAGMEYEFNRVHAVDVYYLIQHDINVNNPIADYVAGIGYVYTF